MLRRWCKGDDTRAERALIGVYFVYMFVVEGLAVDDLLEDLLEEEPTPLIMFSAMNSMIQIAAVIPACLMMANRNLLIATLLLSMAVFLDLILDLALVHTKQKIFSHLQFKKSAMIAGILLLRFHVVATADCRLRSQTSAFAGPLSPTKQKPQRSGRQSTQLLVGRLFVCAVFLMGAGAEILCDHLQVVKHMPAAHTIAKIDNKVLEYRHKIEALRDPGNNENQIQRAANKRKLSIREKALKKYVKAQTKIRIQLVADEGNLFFWPETVFGVAVALGLWMEVTPALLALTLLIEAANIERLIKLGPTNFLEITKSGADECVMEMLCDFCMAGSLILLCKLGGGRYSVDELLKKQD